MSIINKIRFRINRYSGVVKTPFLMLVCSLSNRFSRKSIVSNSRVVVSLTSHGARIARVFNTIETIARGRLLPGQIILWLDDPVQFKSLPPSLGRLKERGLEVRFSENFGPHTKYFPVLESITIPDLLVTADDDILYPSYWLERLVSENRVTPEEIVCFRAHRVSMEGGSVAPYNSWRACETNAASFLNFATGVSGVIYPKRFLEYLKIRGREFVELSPKADDVWLHAMAVKSKMRIRQIGRFAIHFPSLPNSQEFALHRVNVMDNRNDLQIKKAYDLEVIECLRRTAEEGR